MNQLSNMRQLVYVMNALCKVECLLVDMQLSAKDELAESDKAERVLLNLRLRLRGIFDEWFGVFAPEEGVVIDEL